MSIGGVSSTPDNDFSSSLQMLELAEERLEAAYNQLGSLLAMNPELQAALQSCLNAIGIKFSSIKDMKNEILLGSPDSSSPEKINALTSQINDLIYQITIISMQIRAQIQANANFQRIVNDLSQKITTEQASINRDNAKLAELNHSLQAAQSQLDAGNSELESLKLQLDSLNSQLKAVKTSINTL